MAEVDVLLIWCSRDKIVCLVENCSRKGVYYTVESDFPIHFRQIDESLRYPFDKECEPHIVGDLYEESSIVTKGLRYPGSIPRSTDATSYVITTDVFGPEFGTSLEPIVREYREGGLGAIYLDVPQKNPPPDRPMPRSDGMPRFLTAFVIWEEGHKVAVNLFVELADGTVRRYAFNDYNFEIIAKPSHPPERPIRSTHRSQDGEFDCTLHNSTFFQVLNESGLLTLVDKDPAVLCTRLFETDLCFFEIQQIQSPRVSDMGFDDFVALWPAILKRSLQFES